MPNEALEELNHALACSMIGEMISAQVALLYPADGIKPDDATVAQIESRIRAYKEERDALGDAESINAVITKYGPLVRTERNKGEPKNA